LIGTLAVSFEFVTQFDFWLGVGVLAATYGIFALGLQINVGFTGIVNFGQAGFMAIGAYGMAILVVDAGWSFWLALPAAMGMAILAGLLIGLPSLRLRADYFAIVTIAFAEMIRYTAQNARELTGGNQGLLGYDDTWISLSNTIQGWFEPIGLDQYFLLPLFAISWLLFALLIALLTLLQRSPWGRVLRAIREDEDAAAALGKNALSYKLQSLAISSALGAIAGYILALNLSFLNPQSFEPLFTFIGYAVLVLGGLATYMGVALGAILLWTLLEATRYLDLPLAAEKVAALRFMLVGVVLILLMAFRPQGILGKREEMVLGD
jgi:branched-chain amino acid transport system permease protein